MRSWNRSLTELAQFTEKNGELRRQHTRYILEITSPVLRQRRRCNEVRDREHGQGRGKLIGVDGARAAASFSLGVENALVWLRTLPMSNSMSFCTLSPPFSDLQNETNS